MDNVAGQEKKKAAGCAGGFHSKAFDRRL